MTDKQALLDRAAASPEERILLARVLDKYEQMDRRNIPTATVFLSEAEQAAAARLLNAAGIHSGFAWNGGYEGAGRKLLQFLPPWAEEAEAPIAYLRAVFRGEGQPTHRDCLGSLMGLGITREKLGDILVGDGACDLIAAPEIVPFLVDNWTSAGRTRLSVSEIGPADLHVPEQKVQALHDTVMSLRLDAVAATGFGMSRGKAAELIRAGRVQLNHTDCMKPDRAVSQGDVITARGFGKCLLAEVGGLSKKGRIAITVHRYL